MSKNYTVIHCHSDLSNGVTNVDSVTKYDEYIDYAHELGMTSFGFAEHGSVFQFLKKKRHIEELGMKYIHAEEFYVTETLEEKIRDNYHCVLIALNEDGFHELNTLSSIAFEPDHKYYMPRITLDELINTSENIAISTACVGGILRKGNKYAKNKFLQFLIKNKNRCYLEIQHHNDEVQIEYNKYLYELHKKYDIPMVAMTDTHALNKEHLKGRAILQKSKGINFSEESGWDLTFKSYDELVEAFKEQNSLPIDVVLEAIENTNAIAARVVPWEITNEYKYPHLWDSPEKTLMKKIKEGIKRRGIDKYPNRNEYADRIKYELETYRHNGAIEFMLLMEDIIDWCNSKDIKVGYGRGSVNGSIIAYVLGITEMDSIKHNLNFERFMNTERVSLADIDTDFPPSRREDVKDYIFGKVGLHCCDIITFNTIAIKGAVRDVCKALYSNGIPEELQEIVDSEIETYGQMLDDTSKEVSKYTDSYLETASYINKFVEDEEDRMRDEYQDVFEYVDIIKGTIVSVGSHPCGCVVAEKDVVPAFGTFRTSTSKYPISQINMKEIDSLNYVKLDLLNLDTIELINSTCKLAGIERLTPDNIDIADEKVWDSMRDDTTLIFQWEGNVGNSYIKKLLSDEHIEKFKEADENIDRMTLLSIGNSAIRPAGASYREDLASGVVRKSGSKAIDDFLKPTFGYLVFQCQIIEFLNQYCGFTMGEADIVRRHFAKKYGTDKDIPIIKDGGYLSDDKKHYIKGFVAIMKEKYNMSKEDAEETIVGFLQVIDDASRYLLSLNHSQPYSYEGYVSGYLRYYYPTEFITTALNINKDNEVKTINITKYAKSRGIKISGIKFRYSKAEYSCDPSTKTIYKGIESIKYLNSNIADELYAIRDEEFDSFVDVLIAVKSTSVNSKQLQILIKLNFFSEFGEINTLLKQVELFDRIYGKKQFKRDKLEELEIPFDTIEKYATGITEKTIKGFDSVELLKDVIMNYKYKDVSLLERLNYMHQSLGYVDYVDPQANKRCYYVTEVDVKKSIVNAKLYEVYTGNTREVKMWTNSFNKNQFTEEQVLYIRSLEKKNKRERTGDVDPITGKNIYRDVPDQYEFWLKNYDVWEDFE